MISKCHHISVGDKNHIFSIVQRPQRSVGQTMPLAMPRAVSGDQSRGSAAEILFRPRGRGFFHSQPQNHSATLHQSTTTKLQHHTTTAPVHHYNNPQDKNHNQHRTPLFPAPPFPFSLYMCFFVLLENVIFISLHPFQDR